MEEIITGEVPQTVIENEDEETRLKDNINQQIKAGLEKLDCNKEKLDKTAKELKQDTEKIMDGPVFPKPPFPLEPIFDILDTIFKNKNNNGDGKPRLTGIFGGSKIDVELENKHVLNMAITLLNEKLKEIENEKSI